MSAESRIEAVARQHLCAFPTELDELSGRGRLAKVSQAVAILTTADEADKAAGVYRVSLDAAVEAAAKEFCRIHLGDVWDSITEPARDGYRDYFRGVLTAAVMGGAQ